MRRILATYLVICGVLIAAWQSFAQMPLTGAGPAGSLCSPVTYGGSPFYQSLALSDSWTGQDGTLATNNLVSPACATTGAKFTEDSTASAQHDTNKVMSGSLAASSHTLTLYARQVVGTRNTQPDIFANDFSSGAGVNVNLATCADAGSNPSYGSFTFTSASFATGSFNGVTWCQIQMVFSVILSVSPRINIYSLSGTNNSYNGDGTSAIGYWGVNLQ